ncbi:hypothetical protein GCM10019016_121850 [Streptomyces prasinosporus]|uniref:Uncharacterized protein n=1 Tax=Streptomyces prasinosporus TaxID=68256 RepID=A0ABP6UBE1_9ACTN
MTGPSESSKPAARPVNVRLNEVTRLTRARPRPERVSRAGSRAAGRVTRLVTAGATPTSGTEREEEPCSRCVRGQRAVLCPHVSDVASDASMAWRGRGEEDKYPAPPERSRRTVTPAGAGSTGRAGRMFATAAEPLTPERGRSRVGVVSGGPATGRCECGNTW